MSKDTMPLLITRGIITYPQVATVLDVARTFSINAVNAALSDFEGRIILVSQKDPDGDEISEQSIYDAGTLCSIVSVRDHQDGFRIRVNGISRVLLIKDGSIKVDPNDEKDYYKTDFVVIPSTSVDSVEEAKLIKQISEKVKNYARGLIPATLAEKIDRGMNTEDLINQLASTLELELSVKQAILQEKSLLQRLQYINASLDMIKLSNEIDNSINRTVREKSEKQQREYILREKLKATQDELNQVTGQADDDESVLMKKLDSKSYPDKIKERILKEFNRYKTLPAASLESTMQKTYIDWLVDLPWLDKTDDNDDLDNVEKILNEDHYGLENVKERIIEYIAVKQVTNSLKAPILCLYGPPGVGKTSLAKSIARALGRKFVKASLGGLYDEAELRGHRRTYVGAMPGKIIKGIKNAGYCNPVFLLDEVDKLASSNHGDPASALLEILDPEQNITFQDNYLEETYDLSNVLFIATANYLQNIPAPLRDRLELIELNSYTEIEKINIARDHLIPKQAKINGLDPKKITFDDASIKYLINFYTREAGVRELERLIASIIRKVILELLRNKTKKKVTIDEAKIKEYLGTYKYEYSKKLEDNQIGVVTGLAYTQFGGDILPIEVTYFEGKGELVLTGNLGDVMKESARIALDYVRANSLKYEIAPSFFDTHGIHIHVPEGAVPKDGPSAGIAITTAIISSLSSKKVRASVAMTGEVNLRGHALPIGGLKEKSLAAYRSGIKTILIPKENEKDIQDIPQEVKENLNIILMDKVDDAVREAIIND